LGKIKNRRREKLVGSGYNTIINGVIEVMRMTVF